MIVPILILQSYLISEKKSYRIAFSGRATTAATAPTKTANNIHSSDTAAAKTEKQYFAVHIANTHRRLSYNSGTSRSVENREGAKGATAVTQGNENSVITIK